jgi:hypothetical protein
MAGQYRDDDPRVPKSGDVIHVTKSASVQFAAPMLFRVIRVHNWTTYDGWIWLDGYELNPTGDAVERRSIFVQLHGLRRVNTALPRRVVRKARNAGPQIPKPRTPSDPITPTRRNR